MLYGSLTCTHSTLTLLKARAYFGRVLGIATLPKLSMTTAIFAKFTEATNVNLVYGISKHQGCRSGF